MEWGLSRAEILQISHNAMGQNCATWLISRSCLSKMSNSSSFLGIYSQPTEYYRKRRIVLWWFCPGLNNKTWEIGFRGACLSGKFESLHVLVFSEIEDYRKVLIYHFSCKWSYFLFCGFFALFGRSCRKMWLQIFILRPHVVLKDLFCLVWCSARNCAAPINVVGK